ncbi:MAG TPA: hypothetical protein PKH10_10310, partial [bacterium]|nr:hypothetical protein [bacterium]
FVRAFPPPAMGHDTVLTREMISQWGMDKMPQWEFPPDKFAALDPAFARRARGHRARPDDAAGERLA